MDMIEEQPQGTNLGRFVPASAPSALSNVKRVLNALFWVLLVLGIAVRLGVGCFAGNSVRTPWSGGGDMPAYILLATNLASGDGYTYAHMPTAFRNPGYPLFLAGTLKLFGNHFLFAARILQVLAGFAAVFACMKAAQMLFGKAGGRAALIAALLFPSLIYFSGEILSEGLASLFLALFLWFFAAHLEEPNWKNAAGMGLAMGFGFLVRANTAVVGLVWVLGMWLAGPKRRATRELAIVILCVSAVAVPWIVRNWVVFGRPLISTQSGAAALVSVVNPDARRMPGWGLIVRDAVGYFITGDLETNDPKRLVIGSELDMDRQCWQAAKRLWQQRSTEAKRRWVLQKWTSFWFATDQLLHPGVVSKVSRVLHALAVFFYWLLLVLAIIGCWSLRKSRPGLLVAFTAYAVVITLLHVPFVMNSRIRTPLLDPIIAVLAGGGAAGLVEVTKQTKAAEAEELQSVQ